jgi:peptidoglycan/LPS O-acetylase OafA/YrhL
MTISQHSTKQLPALTGLRFIAVVMILQYHYNTPGSGPYLHSVCQQLYLGVNVFFVLSGFLICYNYGKEAKLNKQFLKKYYTNRVARIVPLYYILLTSSFIIMHFRQPDRVHLFGVYLLNLSFLKGFSSWYMFSGIYPAWSLTPEVTFYIFFPFIYLLVVRMNWWWQQVVFFWTAGLLLVLFFYYFPFRGFFDSIDFLIMTTFFGRCFEFFTGIWLAFRFRHWQAKQDANYPAPAKRSILYTVTGSCLSLMVIIIAAYISPDKAVAQYPVGKVLSMFIFPVSFAVLLFGLITEITWFSRLLSTSLFQVLGKSAYALFLIHGSFIADWLFSFLDLNLFLVFISLMLLSILLYYLVERPLNKWIKI